MGAHATVAGDHIHVRALIVSPDGAQVIRQEIDGAVTEASALGQSLGEQLLAAGGKQILDAVYGANA